MKYFPDSLHEHIGNYLDGYLDRLRTGLLTVDREQLEAAADTIADTVRRGGTIFSCGNGGSAAIANHLACDCLKGMRNKSTLEPRVVSLSTAVELITAIANDIGYDDVFRFQLSSLAKTGDVLIAISSSGESPNIVKALDWAASNGVRTIAMTGFNGGMAARMADVRLHIDAHNYGVVEDAHQSLMHILAQYLRHRHLAEPKSLGAHKF
jgi:phosphoheptose isomerase